MTLRSTTLAVAALGLAAGPALAADYAIDPAHSQVNFRIDHAGFSTVWGRFNDETGTVSFDAEDPASASIELVIQAASVDTNHGARDDHLRSPDFFNAAEFPEITFTSTGVEVTGDNTARVTGDLTMLGVTTEVTFDTVFNKVGSFPWAPDTEVVGFTATGMVDRFAHGMTFGEGSLGNPVEIVVEVEAHATGN